jgi:hypothetical protein
MKKALKQAYLLLVAFSLTLILADCDFIDNAFSHNPIITLSECPGTSNCFGHSHSVCFDDDVFITDSKVKSDKFLTCIGLIPILKFNFKNSFITNIWQPPKFS